VGGLKQTSLQKPAGFEWKPAVADLEHVSLASGGTTCYNIRSVAENRCLGRRESVSIVSQRCIADASFQNQTPRTTQASVPNLPIQ
jgi:hypothetical protein